MAIINKCKKIIFSIGIAFITMINKVSMARVNATDPAYGIPSPKSVSKNIFDFPRILAFIIVPLALLVGAIIYFKKSTRSTKHKILAIVIVVLLLILVGMVIATLTGNKGLLN